MDWTQIITAFLASGALVSVFLIVEKKSGAAIDNALKLCEASMKRTETLTEKYHELANEYQENSRAIQERLDAKETELLNQFKINSSLHHKMDDAHTRCAILEVTHCELALSCPNKRPPLKDTAAKYLQETAAHGIDK